MNVEFDKKNWQLNFSGTRNYSNLWIPIFLIIAGTKAYEFAGFLSLDFSKINTQQVISGPQTFSLLLYASAALVIGGFLAFSIFSNVGASCIKFDKKNEQLILSFQGYKTANQRKFLSYNFREVQAIKILYTEVPRRKQTVIFALDGGRELPIWVSEDASLFQNFELFLTDVGLEMGFCTEISESISAP